MRRVALLVPLFMLIAFIGLALFRLGKPAEQTIESQLVGKPVPALDLPGLDAQNPSITSADLAQGTVTLVNIFASWCVPCRVEAPQLQALADKGVVIHGIAVRDKNEAVARFLDTYGDPFRRIGLDPTARAQIALGVAGVPETLLVDGSGVIRRQYIGVIRPEQVPEILNDIVEAKR